jgi:hypothetical protein
MTSRDLACCLACCALPLQYSVSTRRFRQTWHCDNVRLGGHYLLHGGPTGYDSLHHSHASCLTSSPATPLSPPYASQVNTARIWQSHGPHHCRPATTPGHWQRSHFKSGLKHTVYLGYFFERRGIRTRVAATQVCLRHRHRWRVLDGMSARIGLVALLPRHHTHLAHVHIVPIYRGFGVHHRVLPCMLRVICGFQKKRHGFADRHPGAFFQFSSAPLVLRVAM